MRTKPTLAFDDDPPIQTILVPCAPERPEAAFALGGIAALATPAVCLALGVSPAWLPGVSAVWRAAHLSADTGLTAGPFTGVLATQVMIFVSVALAYRALEAFAPQSGWWLPRWRVDRQARDLLDRTRPGILLYIAETQREARVLATKEVIGTLPDRALDKACEALVSGMRQGDAVAAFASARVALRTPR